LVGRPDGRRPLGRPRRRWEDNIKIDLREIRIDGANWIQLAQDRGELNSAGSGYGPMAGFCEHGEEPSGSIKKAGYF
jgi:hypothetical protein